MTAVPVHPYKFTLVQHFQTYDNPYGLRLLSRCLWPVAFKRAGTEFLMRFAEKFGQPWVVGEVRPAAQPSEMQDMATALACIETGRRFVGVELSGEYFEVAKERIATAEYRPK